MSKATMSNREFGSDEHQSWINEIQIIVGHFVQNDHDLGELMLDHSARFWDEHFMAGLTPQQALDECVNKLQTTNVLEKFKAFKKRMDDDSWWVSEIRGIFLKLSKVGKDDETARENCEHELELLIDEILFRYRGGTTETKQ